MFINYAYAQAQAATQGPGIFEQIVPFIFMFAIVYFLFIRPQAKRSQEHQKFLNSIKRGDSVITSGGMLGKIEGVTDKFVTLEVSAGVKVRILKNQISSPMQEGGANV